MENILNVVQIGEKLYGLFNWLCGIFNNQQSKRKDIDKKENEYKRRIRKLEKEIRNFKSDVREQLQYIKTTSSKQIDQYKEEIRRKDEEIERFKQAEKKKEDADKKVNEVLDLLRNCSAHNNSLIDQLLKDAEESKKRIKETEDTLKKRLSPSMQ